MNMKFATLSLALASAALLTVAGCGGSNSAPPDTSSSITISGVAATGAAFVDAVVTVIDSTGAVVGTSGTVGTDGTYSVTLAAGAKAPFVLVASRTTADGEVQSLVSVIDSATTTTANVTPITHLIASLLSPSGDPSKLAEELAAGTASITPDSVAATVTEVKTILATLLDATGTTGTDPLTGSFTVDGTGYDRLLDSISINIVPSSETSSNIEIAVKQELPDGTQPTTTSFTSDDPAPAPLPTIDPSTLVEEGTSVKIANLLAELTACYALPVDERVNGTVDGSNFVGTASNVIAPACRAVFSGGDPASYKSNGNLVGRDSNNNGAFTSLFRANATGIVFSQGTYEFTRGNGDLVVGYKIRGTDGSESFDTLVVRKDLADLKLKAIGNQYNYPGGVSAYQQHRQFITLGQENYSYYSTGYNMNVNNLQNGSGALFDRVEVTTPRGTTLTLLPSSGSGNLTLPDGKGQPSGTNFVRLRSEPDNAALVTAHPKTYESAALFFVGTDRTEEELANTPAQSVWTFRYFLAGNTGTTADATQTYKTRARALTIGELRTKKFAALTPSLVADINSGADPTTGQIRLDENQPAYIETDGGGDGWSVPAGALPPTSLTLFGRYLKDSQRPRFDDSATVRSTARKGTIFCSSASLNDTHCSTTVPGGYGPNVDANGLHLWARDSGGREFASFYAMYQLTPP